MKAKYTPEQIETIKSLCAWEITTCHGNTKKIKGIPKAEFIEIVEKKRKRYTKPQPSKIMTTASLVKELVMHAKRTKGTPYFKTLIEGNTGIYYASPMYGHRDYNKTRVMDKTPHNMKLMEIFNKIVNR